MASRIVSPPERILRPLLRGVAKTAVRTYRAAVCQNLGKPLVIQDLPAAKALKNGQVRVAVKYCGINFSDILTSMGMYQEQPPLPAVLGGEFSGEVLEVSDDVKSVAQGDHVLGLSFKDGFAEECVLNSQFLWKVPKSLDLRDVAALAACYGTAWVTLTRRAKVQEGETVLVTAAAGGVGMAAVDIASNVLNAKVIGAAGGEAKTKLVLEKGAFSVIDYKAESIREKVKEITHGKGVDVVVESVGGDTTIDCVRSMSWEGRLVVVGFASGEIPQIPANLLLVKNCSAVGVYWGAYGRKDPQVLRDSVDQVLKLVEERKIHPHISKVFPLAKINQAFKFISDRQSTGKVLVDMQNSS